MFLKNYTSEVAASTTIQRIVTLLIRVGISTVSMDYAPDGSINGVTFSVRIETRTVPIRVPVDVDAAWNALWMDYVGKDRLSNDGTAIWNNSAKRKTKKMFRDQAQRTAWKLMQDWIEVQISLIQMKQADLLQVFLPYVWNGDQTFYHRLKASQFKALEAPKVVSPEAITEV